MRTRVQEAGARNAFPANEAGDPPLAWTKHSGMKSRFPRLCASVCFALMTARLSMAEIPTDWPQFRGANGQGVIATAPPPAMFGLNSNLLWKTAMAPGHSSPVVIGGRLFLTTFDEGRLHTVALDASTGVLLWKAAVPARSIERVHSFASPATPTPTATASRVVSYFGSYGLICHDHSGSEIWKRPFPTPKNTYGTSTSPIRAGDRVVVVMDSNDKTSKIMALNLADGTTAWEAPRPLASSGWATPMVWEQDDHAEIVVLGSRRLHGYDASNGKELWWVDGYSTETISVPVTGNGVLFVSSAGLAGPPSERYEPMTWKEMLPLDKDGDGLVEKSEMPDDFRFVIRPELPPEHPGRFLPNSFRSMFDSVDGNRDGRLSEAEFLVFAKQWSARAAPSLKAIRARGSGDVTQTHVIWQLTRGIPEIPSPMYAMGRIYLVRDGGFVACVDSNTGELMYQERVGAPGSYCASPVGAGDRIFFASHNGIITCISSMSKQLEVLGKSDLGERIWATPALSDRTFYVRTEKSMYAFREPARKPGPISTTPDVR